MMDGREPVLLLHGQPGSAGDWAHVVDELGDRVRPIALDRPGWDGRTPAGGLAANAHAALASLEAMGIEHATVAGYSFGAAVACWLAAEAPERVRALVLAAPAANLSSLYRFDRWLTMPGAGELASAAGLQLLGFALGARRLRRRIAVQFSLAESYLEAFGRALRSPAAWRSFVVEQRALVSELPALERRLSEISATTTIVVGSHDWIVPRRSSRRLAEQIPGAELLVLEHAGHLLPVQHAPRLAEVIVAASGA